MKSIPTVSNTIALSLALIFSHNLLAENSVLSKDIFFGSWSPWKRNWEISLPVCVFTTTNNSLFTVTASGQYAGTEYFVSNDLSDRVNYQVYWHYGRQLRQSEMLRSGIQSTGIYRYNKNKHCDKGPGNQVRVKLDKSQIDQAIAGIYNDTLLLVLAPI